MPSWGGYLVWPARAAAAGGVDGVGRAVEVGLADGQRDDGDAVGAHGAGADGHGDRRGGGQVV